MLGFFCDYAGVILWLPYGYAIIIIWISVVIMGLAVVML